MTDVALVAKNVPTHVSKSSGLGNEDVSAEHLQTPRVKQL